MLFCEPAAPSKPSLTCGCHYQGQSCHWECSPIPGETGALTPREGESIAQSCVAGGQQGPDPDPSAASQATALSRPDGRTLSHCHRKGSTHWSEGTCLLLCLSLQRGQGHFEGQLCHQIHLGLRFSGSARTGWVWGGHKKWPLLSSGPTIPSGSSGLCLGPHQVFSK